ncbi:MAG: hypothetical protein DWQ36_01005 [Acidobacteria bacterium]|nr:MAG: hypothetical protein DWQ30_15090 [Acidobacteriota bacterium]REK11752.1 MAG: hypothetical protein DWQ36_01005 [Acidobacteriota bacterium]
MSTFVVKDLMVSVLSDRGSVGLCAEDVSATVPTPLTPVVLVAAQTPVLQHVQHVTKRLVAAGDADGSPAVVEAIDEVALDIGRGIVVAAAQGGGVMLPDPNCGGTSLETIPTPITPVVHKNAALLRVSHLRQLKAQLHETLAAVDKAQAALVPSGRQVAKVRKQLEGALESLG